MNNKLFVSAFAWLLVCTALATAPKAQGQSANYGVRSAGALQISLEVGGVGDPGLAGQEDASHTYLSSRVFS